MKLPLSKATPVVPLISVEKCALSRALLDRIGGVGFGGQPSDGHRDDSQAHEGGKSGGHSCSRSVSGVTSGFDFYLGLDRRDERGCEEETQGTDQCEEENQDAQFCLGCKFHLFLLFVSVFIIPSLLTFEIP